MKKMGPVMTLCTFIVISLHEELTIVWLALHSVRGYHAVQP